MNPSDLKRFGEYVEEKIAQYECDSDDMVPIEVHVRFLRELIRAAQAVPTLVAAAQDTLDYIRHIGGSIETPAKLEAALVKAKENRPCE
jgi:hypothetical protein